LNYDELEKLRNYVIMIANLNAVIE